MDKKIEISMLLDLYKGLLTDKQAETMELYYNEDLSLSEIAENEGITRQGVSDLIKRAEAQLEAWEQKCHYCESVLRLKELAESVRLGETAAVDKILDIVEKL